MLTVTTLKCNVRLKRKVVVVEKLCNLVRGGGEEAARLPMRVATQPRTTHGIIASMTPLFDVQVLLVLRMAASLQISLHID